MIPIATIVEDSPENTLHPIRPIRSFVRRTGRTTAGQAKAFADVGPQFLLRMARMGCSVLSGESSTMVAMGIMPVV